PGTDHAGIATQNVVEKKLRSENKNKNLMGREKFLEEIWKWREEYGSTIINQLKKLGSSCDWDRTRFTMDEGLSEAVVEVFVRLYEKKLIYRGNYIINWCPRCGTALSDEESEHRDVDGMLYHIKYPIKGSKLKHKGKPGKDYLVVATTRPETMLGDVAVCVNPKDKRYKHLEGSSVILPIIERELKIIFDSKVDISFGTGVLKVTPAHDPVDFELGLQHKLEALNVMNDDATMNESCGDFKGMDRFECREAVIEELKKRNLFIKAEPHRHAVGHCYRCHVMVEPRLSRQWFVKMAPLARPALKAVLDGKIKFYPKRWTKVYINWMKNIRDWCISRQIWWGHRIPVYYCSTCGDSNGQKNVIVSKVKPESCPKCGSTDITQDPDVLDTWFSSWLWPFSTLGWPKDTKELGFFYPTNALVTAQEIIFFWVARMIMAGIEFMGEIPFSDIYIHGTVRDDTGTKMSKSLGNIIDPIDIINKFGTDALRFSIISITAQGQDVFLAPQKFELGRNFANKLWNASRFVLMNLKVDAVKNDLCQILLRQSENSQKLCSGGQAANDAFTLADKWILSRFYQALGDFSKSLESYRINEAANRIYEFIWHEFCDWYLELAKLTMQEPHTQITLYKVLEKSLRMLHPVMPFVTEEIWQRLPREHGTESIMITKWPHMQKAFISKKVDSDMDLLIKIIQAIRNLRATWRIEHGKEVDVFVKVGKKGTASILNANDDYIKRLARVKNLQISETVKKMEHTAFAGIEDIEIFLSLEGVIDVDKEKKRLKEKIDNLASELKRIEVKLKNKGFTSKAPKEVILKAKERKLVIKSETDSLKKNLASL
ncbi:MAG: valine--tRNA ligase, partial [Candidatus Omnitrophota bacterium]